jgi:hypothetical protein
LGLKIHTSCPPKWIRYSAGCRIARITCPIGKWRFVSPLPSPPHPPAFLISYPIPLASPLKRHPLAPNPLHLLLPPPLRSSLNRPSPHRHPLRLLLAHRQRRRRGREDPVPRHRQVNRERLGVHQLAAWGRGRVAPGFVFGSDCPGSSFSFCFPPPFPEKPDGERGNR